MMLSMQRACRRSEVLSSRLQTKITTFPEPLVGIVEATITRDRAGRVQCIGTSWPARFYQTNPFGRLTLVDERVEIAPGTPVKIVALWGITMLVLPVADCAEPYPLAA